MTKTMTIAGMSCAHCAGAVKKALEGVDGVRRAEVRPEAGNATVELSGEVADDILRAAVEEAGYEVTGLSGESLPRSL